MKSFSKNVANKVYPDHLPFNSDRLLPNLDAVGERFPVLHKDPLKETFTRQSSLKNVQLEDRQTHRREKKK